MKPSFQTNEDDRAWIEAHREEFLGQWVALDGGNLISHGADARTVCNEARAKGVDSPYLERVMPKVEAYVGGWLTESYD